MKLERPRIASSIVVLALQLQLQLGCQEQREDAQQAVSAAKQLVDLAQQGDVAQKAAAAAEKLAREQLAPGTDPAAAQQQVDLAKGIAAAKAFAGGGPVVGWRQLAPLLPDALGDYKAKGELDGSTKKVAGFEMSEVKRRYEAGDSNVSIEIIDTSGNNFLRAPFAMAAMVEEDTSSGFKKGKKLGDHSAIVEWRERDKQSKIAVLVNNRFVVNVRVTKAKSDVEAETIAAKLGLDALAKLEPEAPAAAPAVAAPTAK